MQTIVANVKENMKLYRAEHSWLLRPAITHQIAHDMQVVMRSGYSQCFHQCFGMRIRWSLHMHT